MLQNRKKILAVCLPIPGHLNMMCSLINELVNKKKFHVIMYMPEKYKNLVEKSGSEYREFKAKIPMIEMTEKMDLLDLFELMLTSTQLVLPELIDFCNEEKPDIIMSSIGCSDGRYLINHLTQQAKKKKLNYKLPKAVILCPSFAFLDGVYPATKEKKLLFQGDTNFKVIKKYLRLCLEQRKINKKFDLSLSSNLKKNFNAISSEDHLYLCGVLHELQPKADNMIHKYKFIGSCITDEVRNFNVSNEKLKLILNHFEPKNPINLSDINNQTNSSKKKLIYASLGTVANDRIEIYEKIINAFNSFVENNVIKNDDIELVVSVGNSAYDKFQHKIENENYNLPDNVLLLPYVPQIEILKRASLYILHCGMNR
jgi:UDP:flavonoid glycosyltransferase YjiC (YdhE family)